LKILAIGSSSTEGIGASAPQFTYPARLKAELTGRFPAAKIDVRNAGIGGETIDQTLKRLGDELDRYKPDLVLWQVGTNDAVSGNSDPEIFHKMVDQGVKSIQQQKIDAILIDSQFYLKIPDTKRYEHYVDLVHTTGDDDGVVVFPRYKLMQAWNAEPGGVTPMLGPDRFHMGDRGYACLANLLASEIVTSLARTSATAGSTKPLQP
jgi:lysophospholipase L1-like esterase